MNEKYHITIIMNSAYSMCFKEIAESLLYSFQDLGIDCSFKVNTIEKDRINILIGYHDIKDQHILQGIQYIVYQLESLKSENTLAQRNSPYILDILKNANDVWDYSEENRKWLLDKGVNSRLLIPGYHSRLERIDKDSLKDIDILFYGKPNKRRRHFIEKINDKCEQNVFIPEKSFFGEKRDELISKSKIILNLHYYEDSVFEMVRVSYLINNKKLVITEDSEDIIDLNLVTIDENNMGDTLKYFLENENKLEEKIEETYLKFKQNYNMPELLERVLK